MGIKDFGFFAGYLNRKKIKMKKIFAILLSVALVASLSASSFAAVKKVVKKKPVVKKKVVKPAPKKIVPKKPAIETPWVPPTPAPVAPAPSPTPASAAAGMGMTVGAKVGLTAGLMAVTGDFDYSLAGILPGAKARLSVDYVSGNNPNSSVAVDTPMKSVDIKIGGTYALDMLKSAALPVDWYVGAAYILPVKVNGARTGGYGYEGYVGGTYKVPDFGSIYGELGYAGLKVATAPALKGVNAAVGYAYSF